MAMANVLGSRRKPHITKQRKAVNDTRAAPSGSEYPLTGFGSGKVTDKGRLTKAIDWRNR